MLASEHREDRLSAGVRRSGRRSQAEADRTRRAILDAALDHFARQGFEGASSRRIAQDAGVNHTLISHHFGSKDALWKAVAEDLFAGYEARLSDRADALSEVSEAERVRLLLREFVLFSADVPHLHRFMMQANLGDASRLDWLVDRFLMPRHEQECDLVVSGQSAGAFVDGDAVHLRYLFIGAATSIFTFAEEFRRVSGQDPFTDSVRTRHLELVLELFGGVRDGG